MLPNSLPGRNFTYTLLWILLQKSNLFKTLFKDLRFSNTFCKELKRFFRQLDSLWNFRVCPKVFFLPQSQDARKLRIIFRSGLNSNGFCSTSWSQFCECVLHSQCDSYIRDMIPEIWMSSLGITSPISRGLALFQRISGPFAELQIIKSTMGRNLWGHLEDTENKHSVSLSHYKSSLAQLWNNSVGFTHHKSMKWK